MNYRRDALPILTLLTVVILLGQVRYFGLYDLLPLWGGVHVFLDGGNPYDFETLKNQISSVLPGIPETQHFVSPPWTLTFIVGLFAGSFNASRVLLIALSISAFYISIIRLQRMWGVLPRPCTFILWGYIPLWACLYFGQLSVFLLLGTVLALEWIQDPKPRWWKWAIALTLLALKPQGFLLAFPFLIGEFLRRSSRREQIYLVGYAAVIVALMSPSLTYLSSWLGTASFSYSQDSATLSRYVRELGESLGNGSALFLWILPVVAFLILARRGLCIKDSHFFLIIILLCQLTAPYIWVYDSCALMPLFYAYMGTLGQQRIPLQRRRLALILTSLSVLPAYMAISPDFKFMVMHNVALAGAFLALSPELRRYLCAEPRSPTV